MRAIPPSREELNSAWPFSMKLLTKKMVTAQTWDPGFQTKTLIPILEPKVQLVSHLISKINGDGLLNKKATAFLVANLRYIKQNSDA